MYNDIGGIFTKVSAIQLSHSDTQIKSERLSHAESLIRTAADSDLILLPELWNTGFFSYDEYERSCEADDGETISMLSRLAADIKAYIFTGSFVQKRNGKLYNTAMLLDRSGATAASYSKIHLFGEERQYMTCGDKAVTVDTELGKIGLSICYDLRFPEQYRRMTDCGAEIFLSCYALPASRTEHWRILTPARALENQAYFFSCGCSGINRGVHYSGHSTLIAPDGAILAEGADGEEILTADADIECVRRFRRDFPVLKDRNISF
ncbi:MAG: carbon-nitrogen family hydrolase [Clostridia bacterium]|nr:carbon-nitrogen family hydrolase [Clostridia bacterium]